nr:L-xylulose reductase [Onthophagus taurus]
MEISFKGKRALVTGASQGIGRDIVKQLVACGAHVIAISRSKDLLESLKSETSNVEIKTADLSNWEETENVLKDIGPIDLLINNAAVALLAPILEITQEHIDKSFDLNIKSIIHITQIIAKNMIARNISGSIVNISSQASMAGLKDHGVYCATKGALDAFTRVAAAEFGAYNIRVNCVNPTVIMTAMGRIGWSNPKIADPMKEKIPLKRFGEVREVTDAVLYLLSDKSSLITGSCLPVDGGFLAI